MSGNTAMLDAKTIKMDAPPAKKIKADKKAPVIEKKQPLQKRAENLINIKVPGISIFAIIGTLIISVLMVFVVLAQVSYNEAATEAVRMSTQLRTLTEKHRTLELAFESSIDLKEIERIARDELGMSRPDAAQIMTITTLPRDTAVVITPEQERGVQGFAEFLKSLTDYFRR
ncbi:MAG: cell division protein FtsL [Oscillospiraceae bacterium]|nr:cell division protein FtsL [Oscillospiraceae bacterium]